MGVDPGGPEPGVAAGFPDVGLVGFEIGAGQRSGVGVAGLVRPVGEVAERPAVGSFIRGARGVKEASNACGNGFTPAIVSPAQVGLAFRSFGSRGLIVLFDWR